MFFPLWQKLILYRSVLLNKYRTKMPAVSESPFSATSTPTFTVSTFSTTTDIQPVKDEPFQIEDETPNKPIPTLKIIVVGDSGVGKSALLAKYLRGDTNTKSTIGADHYQKDVSIKGKKVRLQFWDTAGQERYHSIVKSYFNGVHAVLLVFDVTQVKTLHNMATWIRMVESHAPETARCIMVGNKCDLVDLRAVSSPVALTVAESRDMFYIETSASLGSGVNEAFQNIAQMAYYSYTSCPPKAPSSISIEHKKEKKTSCCGK